jgi:hypothetical protein
MMPDTLDWFQVWGSFALALVAATSAEEALAMIRAHAPDTRWGGADKDSELPGPPSAPGVYACFVE